MKRQETYGTRAARSFAWNHFYKLSEFGLLNVYTMLIARYFGPVGSTPFVVYAAAGTTLSLFGAFAVDGVLLRYLPRLAESSEAVQELAIPGVSDLRSFVRKLFAFRLFVVLCVVSLLLLCVSLFTGAFPASANLDSIGDLAPLLSIFLLAQAVIAFSTFALIGLLRTKIVFISSVIARASLVVVALVLILGLHEFSVRTAIVLHAASAIVNAVLMLYSLRTILGRSRPKDRGSLLYSIRSFALEMYGFFRHPSSIKLLLVSPVMLYGLTTWGNDALGLLLGRQSDILMIRALFGESTSEVGYYNVASLILLLTEYIFLLGFGGALVSVFSKLAHDDERAAAATSGAIGYERLNRGRAEVAGFQAVALLPLCAFVFMFPLTVMRAIYGSQYDVAAPLVQHGLLALVVNIAMFNGGLQITSLLAIGKQRLVLKNRLSWAVFNVVTNYFLIRSYGALGAMIGTNWTNTMACATEWYFARKYIGSVGKGYSTLRILAISVGSALAVYAFMPLVGLDYGPIVEIVAAGLIFFTIVLALFYLFRVPETTVVLSRLKKAFA